jgi:hypothetical protein
MTKHIPVFATPDMKLSRDARRALGKYTKRIPLAGEAAPARINLWSLPVYVPPAAQHQRAGSEIAFAIKSKGLST